MTFFSVLLRYDFDEPFYWQARGSISYGHVIYYLKGLTRKHNITFKVLLRYVSQGIACAMPR